MLKFLFLLSFTSPAQSLLEPVYISDQTFDQFATFESVRSSPVSFERYKIQQNISFTRLSDWVVLDSSLSESYNSVGYWDQLSLRGIKLNNRTNYFRNGLPISAETAIPMENKAEIQILKGLSGLQFGTPSAAGLINYRTKAPDFKENYNSVSMGASSAQASQIHLDSNIKTSETTAWRANLSLNALNSYVENTRGHREVMALAYSKKLGDAMLEFEWEFLNQAQPSQAALSLVGTQLPSLNPNLNLNNQPWSRPVEFQTHTASLTYTKPLSGQSYLKAQVGAQWIKTQDNLAYPFGCGKENNYDRFCSDNTMDMYDFRSRDESRQMLSANMELHHSWAWDAIQNQTSIGFMVSDARDWFHKQAYNYVGEGSLSDPPTLPPDPAPTDENTNRFAQNAQISLNNKAEIDQWDIYTGVKFAHIRRESYRTDGSRNIDYSQNQATPWLALGFKIDKDHYSYLSYSQSFESYVVPNKSSYTNAGQVLPDSLSNQLEWGFKGPNYNVAIFSIEKPYLIDMEPDYYLDGKTTVYGAEAGTRYKNQSFEVHTQATYLQAKRPSLETKYLPHWSGRLHFLTPSDLKWGAGIHFTYNSEKQIETQKIPEWILTNLSIRYAWSQSLLEFFVYNVFDQKYYREASEQYGHYFLFPEKQRTVFLNYKLLI